MVHQQGMIESASAKIAMIPIQRKSRCTFDYLNANQQIKLKKLTSFNSKPLWAAPSELKH